jgi:hypothetical protein
MFALMLLRAVNGDRMMFIRGNHEGNACLLYAHSRSK